MMGKIACANVLSDLYAMGVMDCDNMLMLLAISTKMTEKERDVVIPLIMRGFKVRNNSYKTPSVSLLRCLLFIDNLILMIVLMLNFIVFC